MTTDIQQHIKMLTTLTIVNVPKTTPVELDSNHFDFGTNEYQLISNLGGRKYRKTIAAAPLHPAVRYAAQWHSRLPTPTGNCNHPASR